LLSVLFAGVLPVYADSRKTQKLRNNFVPPPAAAPAEVSLVEPPHVESGFFAKEMPVPEPRSGPATPRTFETDLRLRRSEQHFQEGSRLLAAKNGVQARIEFDRAIEQLISAPANLPDRARLAQRYETLAETIYRLEADATAEDKDAEPSFDKAPLEDVVELTFPVEPGLKALVREQVQATVSQLPLETTDAVLSFINYFSTARGRRVLTVGLTRMGRYAPMIRRILDEEGLPQELIHLAQAESGFLPRAMSRMKAGGMWQFVKFRGNEYGLKQTPLHDDRFDPELATRAAARHLRDLYAEFGDWYLAVAAYNCGPGNVSRAIERTGYADFWELYKRNSLPRETASYLPIILAMTIMAKNPQAYGLEEIVPDPPLGYESIELTAPTHLALIADAAGRPLNEIRDLNPAVLKLVAPAGYRVHVPKGAASTLAAALEGVPAARRASWRVHRVGSDETLSFIARQYRTTEKQIVAANGGDSVEAEAGDLIVIPVSYPGAQTAAAKSKGKTAAANGKPEPASRKPVVAARSKAPAKRPAASKPQAAKSSTRKPAAKTASTVTRAPASKSGKAAALAARTEQYAGARYVASAKNN
jgi:membrane-bound lytic murein transglycosylase D